MAKYKEYDYSQMVMLPVSLEDQLMPGTLEFAIHALVESVWICLILIIDMRMTTQADLPMVLSFF
jgi:hypothetical protein